MVEPMEERVQRGAQLLDHALGPDWPAEININRLRMDSCALCVIGQLFMDPDSESTTEPNPYDAGLNTLKDTIPNVATQPTRYGFDLAPDEWIPGVYGFGNWAKLNDHWINLIKERRAGVSHD